MNRIIRIVGAVIFVGLLLSGYIGLVRGPDVAAIEKYERQKPNPWPQFKIEPAQKFDNSYLQKYFNQIENYLNQRVLWRTQVLKSYAKLCYQLGVSFTKSAVVGRQDWLFLGNQHGYETDKYLGIWKYDANRFSQTVNNIFELQQYCRKRGITFVYVTAPNKSAVYPEYLPSWARKTRWQNRPEVALGDALRQKGVCFIDTTDPVRNAKSTRSELLYRVQDSHWNGLGAYYAFVAIMQVLQQQNPSIQLPYNTITVINKTSFGGGGFDQFHI